MTMLLTLMSYGIACLMLAALPFVFAFLGGLLIPVLAKAFEYGETLAEKLFGR